MTSKNITTSKIVELRGQQAFTNSLVIAEQCGLTHKQVLANIRKYKSDLEELGLVAFETRPRLDGQHGGGDVEIAILNEDQATYLITLSRNTPKVRQFKLALVKAFRKALNEIDKLYANPPRTDILRDKRKAHNPMMDALIQTREGLGKETQGVHYMSENKLCNGVVTGKFSKIDEKALSNEDALLLSVVRNINESYLLEGLDYKTRKAKLQDFTMNRRTKRLTTKV